MPSGPGAPAASGRLLTACFVVVTVLLAAAVLLLVPWSAAGIDGAPVQPRPRFDFSPAQLARDTAFHADLRPWTYLRLVLALLLFLGLGATRLGARWVGAMTARVRGPWPVAVLLGAVLVTTVTTVLPLPLAAGAQRVLRRWGLSTQGWDSWLVDVTRDAGVTLAVSTVLLALLVGAARRWPARWWAAAAVGAVGLVVLGSTLYPVLVEPLAYDLRPMSAGPQRNALTDLARQAGQPVRQILVADASRRTTAENAYVSGLGATRRLVVYDTLLARAAPAEVELVVAHELGHVAHRDVLRGTTLGALAAAWAVLALALVAGWRRWWARLGTTGPADPRAVATVLAMVACGTYLAAPASTVVSRRVEARADRYALDLTQDPRTFVLMQRQLALANLTDLQPRWYRQTLFSTHPSPPWRVALARTWAGQHGWPDLPGAGGP